MKFSFTAFLVTQICASILICIWCLILNQKKFLNKLYLGFWFFITPLIIIRVLLPFEFRYTITLRSETILPPIADWFYSPVWKDGPISKGNLLIIIWIIGAGIKIARGFLKERKVEQLLLLFSLEEENDTYNFIMDQVEHDLNIKKQKIKIWKTDFVTTPIVVGRKPSFILLPDLSFTEKELYYILEHERIHIEKRDTILLKMVTLLCSIFWWNPFFSLFQKEFSKLLELRVDGILCEKYSPMQQIEYMECILKVYKYQISLKDATKNRQKETRFLAFSRKNTSNLEKRIGYLMEKHSYLYSILISTVFIVIACFSTGFVFEPCSIAPDVQETTFEITEGAEGNYLIQKEDGTYDLYVGGEFKGNIISFNEDDILGTFPIYQEGENN
jgi:beta-lactamase regulating signal transducer with metallopeptidase domain